MNSEIFFCPVGPEHAELFYQWRQDPVMRMYNPLKDSSVEELRERFIKSSSNLEKFDVSESFTWFLKHNGEFVGNINCTSINKSMLTAEIGYHVSSEARGNGIATRALQALAWDIFKKTPLRKLIAFVHEDNLASIKVLEKVGFKKEGLLREHYLLDGKPVNELIYGLLKHEFIVSFPPK